MIELCELQNVASSGDRSLGRKLMMIGEVIPGLVEPKVLDIIAAKPAHRGGHERDAEVGGDKSQRGLQLTNLEANLRLKAKFAIE